MVHPEVRVVAFSPDGQWLATGGEDKTLRFWDSRTGDPIGHPLEHPAEIQTLAFSPDGRRIGTACRDGIGRIWDVTFLSEGASANVLRERICVRTGLRLGPHEKIELLHPDEWRALKAKLDGK